MFPRSWSDHFQNDPQGDIANNNVCTHEYMESKTDDFRSNF